MEILIQIYDFVTRRADTPTIFGGFHIASVAVLLLLTLGACALLKNSSDSVINRFTAFVWVIILVLEIYKQLIYGFDLVDGEFTWDYAWYAFPFQFCSSPLYILPVIAFSKNDRLRDACIAYMMSFSFFAGLAVMCYPGDVFTGTIGINYQTIIHHGSQVLMGAVYAVRYRQRTNKVYFLGGVKVFVFMVIMAMVLNVLVHRAFLIFGIDETFNMFYISPYHSCTLPVLSLVWEKVNYLLFVCIYFFGFIFVAALMYVILKGFTVTVKGRVSSEAKRVKLGKNAHICKQ